MSKIKSLIFLLLSLNQLEILFSIFHHREFFLKILECYLSQNKLLLTQKQKASLKNLKDMQNNLNLETLINLESLHIHFNIQPYPF